MPESPDHIECFQTRLFLRGKKIRSAITAYNRTYQINKNGGGEFEVTDWDWGNKLIIRETVAHYCRFHDRGALRSDSNGV